MQRRVGGRQNFAPKYAERIVHSRVRSGVLTGANVVLIRGLGAEVTAVVLAALHVLVVEDGAGRAARRGLLAQLPQHDEPLWRLVAARPT